MRSPGALTQHPRSDHRHMSDVWPALTRHGNCRGKARALWGHPNDNGIINRGHTAVAGPGAQALAGLPGAGHFNKHQQIPEGGHRGPQATLVSIPAGKPECVACHDKTWDLQGCLQGQNKSPLGPLQSMV